MILKTPWAEIGNDRPAIIAFEGIDGAGKTTILNMVQAELSKTHIVECDKLAPLMLRNFKTLIDEKEGVSGAYERAIPKDIRQTGFLIEGMVKFGSRADRYSGLDVILFDRWIETFEANMGPISAYGDEIQRLMPSLPKPDLTFLFLVDPDVALTRLRDSNDWMYVTLGHERTKERLARLDKAYRRIAERGDVQVLDSTSRGVGELAAVCLEKIKKARAAKATKVEASQQRRAHVPMIAVEGLDGAGKSSVLEALSSTRGGLVVGADRLAGTMLGLFKKLIDEPADQAGAFRDVFSDDFRQQCYIMEASIQLELKRDLYAQHDLIVFDRWFPAYQLYLDGILKQHGIFESLLGLVPQPDLLIRLDVDPKIALERLKLRGDWMLDRHGEAETLKELTWMAEQHRERPYTGRQLVLDASVSKEKIKEQVKNEVKAMI